MKSIREIAEKYPGLKPPGPRYWLIPSVIVALSILLWSSHDTELSVFKRDPKTGAFMIDTPDYRWESALNILAGVKRPVTRAVEPVSIPGTMQFDGNRLVFDFDKSESGIAEIELVSLSSRQGVNLFAGPGIDFNMRFDGVDYPKTLALDGVEGPKAVYSISPDGESSVQLDFTDVKIPMVLDFDNKSTEVMFEFDDFANPVTLTSGLGNSLPVKEDFNLNFKGIGIPVTKMVDGEEHTLMRRDGGLARPDFTPKTLIALLPDMLETIEIALLGTIIAVLFAFPLSFLAARNIVGSKPAGLTVYGVIRFTFNFLSAIPALVVALIFTVIVGVGPAAGVLALGLHSIGMLGRLFAEALENVDRGPIEALQATGAGRIQTVMYGVVPQISQLFLAYSIYRWDINVRMSMILGFVGAGGIGLFLQQEINLFHYTKVSSAFILILITVTLIDIGSSWFQRKVL